MVVPRSPLHLYGKYVPSPRYVKDEIIIITTLLNGETAMTSDMYGRITKFHVAHYCHRKLFMKVNHIDGFEFPLCNISDAEIFSSHKLLVRMGLASTAPSFYVAPAIGQSNIHTTRVLRKDINQSSALVYEPTSAIINLQFCLSGASRRLLPKTVTFRVGFAMRKGLKKFCFARCQ